ncbi:hypothetical protein NQ317_010821 [Molorchus minor]|uniref:Uncharacterized protein n=1 Tax=Molorchus minor TaxID=1323400 RepID=A0ABQ9IVY5_9CUCU|nr:hypothetical protein NQ317_010821 [Molorchus minor]
MKQKVTALLILILEYDTRTNRSGESSPILGESDCKYRQEIPLSTGIIPFTQGKYLLAVPGGPDRPHKVVTPAPEIYLPFFPRRPPIFLRNIRIVT